MPRRPRRQLRPHRYFQVIARGVAGSHIFVDSVDRLEFVAILQQTTTLWGWRLIAWVQMGTHFHIVVEAKQEQMSFAVHRLNCLYAMHFNRRHRRRGHLFENRFVSWVIHDERHLWADVEYVLNNPVRAGLVDTWREWPWSWSELPIP